MTNAAPAAPIIAPGEAGGDCATVEKKAPRLCVECGEIVAVPEKGPGQHKKFCNSVCRLAFANREKAQGAVLVTIAKVHHMTRHAKTTDDRALCASAMTEMTRVLRSFIHEDELAGRASRLPDYVRTLLNVDNCYGDRRRR